MSFTSPSIRHIESLRENLKELKDDFECQLEYVNEALIGIDVESNLDYLIRDNSELVHNHTTETRLRAIIGLKEYYDKMFGDIE
tara:strand:+ start:20 stop:271 length:252 start_codon:yes stop_codon:yes gene_type:complete